MDTLRLSCASLLLAIPLVLPAHAEPVTRLEGSQDFRDDFAARTGDDRIHVVVEIPAGTDALWTLTEDGDALEALRDEEGVRRVAYLPYPGSYGKIPRTRRPPEEGGGIRALGVLLLGPALARGSLVEARPVGVLQLGAGEGRETHVLAVLPGTPLGGVEDLDALRARFPGVASIAETWLRNAGGAPPERPGGLAGPEVAWQRIEAWAAAYEAAEEE